MIWEIKAYAFDLPKTRSKRLKDGVRQKQLEFFIDRYREEYGEPAMVSVHEIGDLKLDDVILEEKRNTTPDHVFIWREHPSERSQQHIQVVE